MDRVGLTIHALAHLTQKDPEVILKNLATNHRVYGQFCTVIKAPVWSWSTVNMTNDAAREPWAIMSQWTLDYIPYPKYVGIEGMKGVKTLSHITQTELAYLKRAAGVK